MPRRLTINDVKNKIEKFGFFIVDGQTYKNNTQKLKMFDAQLNKYVKLSLKDVQYRIKRDKRGEFDYMNILPPTASSLNTSNDPTTSLNTSGPTSSMQRWINRMSSLRGPGEMNQYFNRLSNAEKTAMFTKFNDLMRQFARNQHFRINFKSGDITEKQQLFVLIEALKEYIKKRPKKMIRIESRDSTGSVNFNTLNVDTLNYFTDLLADKPKQEMVDSFNDIYDDYNDWQTVDIYFQDRKKPAGGFFPYINETSFDLSIFGIYHKVKPKNYENNCFLQALINSKLFSKDELNLVSNCMNTRLIKVEDLNDLSEALNCKFTIRIPNDGVAQWNIKKEGNEYMSNEPVKTQSAQRYLKKPKEEYIKTKAIVFKPKSTKSEMREITLILFMNHFMLYKPIIVSEYYLKNFKEIDVKYKDDPERFQIINQEGKKSKAHMSLIKFIKLAIQYKAFTFIPLEKQFQLTKLYKHIHTLKFDDVIDAYFKPIEIKDRNDKQMEYMNKMNNNDGYKLFASHIPREQLPMYYDKLQSLINSLGVHVNVRNYLSFPELMEKVMYEYGCFENVMKICGPIADSIRNSLSFPSPHTNDGKPFYSNKKLYYIDLNGAYLSVIDGIPTGIPDKDMNFTGKNTKIKELLERLYKIRLELKSSGPGGKEKRSDPILANCIKFMSNSSWGLSIRTNKRFEKTKIRSGLKEGNLKNMNDNMDFVVEFNKDFVKYIKSLNVHYSYPQFAREVLRNFNNKISEVISHVKKVYYYNVDALLIDEEDYHKLEQLGYIGNELGQFKIEHIFKEIAIKSPRQYMAVYNDGIFNHTGRDNDYQTFKEGVLSSPDTTKELQV